MRRIVAKSKPRTFFADGEQDGTIRVALSSDDFIFSQSTIISSVCLEDGTCHITPETSKFVNSNGDSWSNESVKANYRSFVGAYNFVNHEQVHEKAVGFIPDVVKRRIILLPEDNIYVYYVDILIATHRDFSELVKKILNNKVEFMSMGCEAYASQCSKCGTVYDDETPDCACLTSCKGKYYIDKSGQKRVISELLGNTNPGSCQFIEASWLTEVPAFHGAAKRHVMAFPERSEVQLVLPKEAFEKPAVQKFLR